MARTTRSLALAAGALWISLLGAPTALATVLDFDDVPVTGNWFLALPGSHYASAGARFSLVDTATGVVQDSLWLVRGGLVGHGSVSGPNSAAIWGGSTLRIRVDFLDPATGSPATVSSVSAMVGDPSTEADLITMDAYDGAGARIGRSQFVSPEGGGYGLVSLSVPGIRRVEFNEFSSGADLDDFTFSPPSTVGVNPEAQGADLVLAPPSPQPWAAGPARLRFALPDGVPARIEMLDVAGRRVFASELGTPGAGWHTLALRADERPRPGLYFVRLRAGSITRTSRLVVSE